MNTERCTCTYQHARCALGIELEGASMAAHIALQQATPENKDTLYLIFVNATAAYQRHVDQQQHSPVNVAQLKPAHTYPTTYVGSAPVIEFTVEGHGYHICGSGERTGLTLHEGWPVYRLNSWFHPNVNGAYVALSPDGFVLRKLPPQNQEGQA